MTTDDLTGAMLGNHTQEEPRATLVTAALTASICGDADEVVEDWARAFRSAMSVRLLVVVRPPSYANMLGRLLVELE